MEGLQHRDDVPLVAKHRAAQHAFDHPPGQLIGSLAQHLLCLFAVLDVHQLSRLGHTSGHPLPF
eukprot:1351502-Rhodomonas_salina.4